MSLEEVNYTITTASPNTSLADHQHLIANQYRPPRMVPPHVEMPRPPQAMAGIPQQQFHQPAIPYQQFHQNQQQQNFSPNLGAALGLAAGLGIGQHQNGFRPGAQNQFNGAQYDAHHRHHGWPPAPWNQNNNFQNYYDQLLLQNLMAQNRNLQNQNWQNQYRNNNMYLLPQYGYGGYPQYGYAGYPQYGYGAYSPYAYDGYTQYGYGGYPQYGYGGYQGQFGRGAGGNQIFNSIGALFDGLIRGGQNQSRYMNQQRGYPEMMPPAMPGGYDPRRQQPGPYDSQGQHIPRHRPAHPRETNCDTSYEHGNGKHHAPSDRHAHTHTVAEGESLWKIAKHEICKSGKSTPSDAQIDSAVKRIAKANEHRYPSLKNDPDHIETGWKIRIPRI